MKPRIRYIRAHAEWSVTFDPGFVLHFGTYARACAFARSLALPSPVYVSPYAKVLA